LKSRHDNWNGIGQTFGDTDVCYQYLNIDANGILKCPIMDGLEQDRNDLFIALLKQGDTIVLTDASVVRRGSDCLGNTIFVEDVGFMMQYGNLCSSNLKNIKAGTWLCLELHLKNIFKTKMKLNMMLA
jgi:hypothetical protein